MKRYQLVLLAAFSAVLLSLPWLNILPGWILFFAFFPLLIVEDQIFQEKETKKSTAFFAYAYACFWLWNALSTWWVMNATFAGIILVVFLNATFMATVWWLFHLMKRRFSTRMANLSLVVFWITFEYLHFNWEIEWPWLTLGNGFANQVKLVQWYEFTGVLGGTLWVLLINLLLFQLYKISVGNGIKKVSGKLVVVVLLIIVPVIYSIYRYSHYVEKGKTYEVVVLQPNVDPYHEKFSGISKEKQVQRLIELADSMITDSTDYVVGPETALHPLWESPQMINHPYISPFYQRVIAHPKLKFVLGATTEIVFRTGEKIPETARKFAEEDAYYDVYNSALQIDASGKVQAYHKSILVSGVEKMPFRKYLSFVEDFIVDLGGTTGSLGSQKEPSNFSSADGLSVAPVICYESVFGEYIAKYIKKGAGLIFVITNDGWWKDTPGYKQHFSFARLRAIETRRSIARSANTGISAFINQRGDILKKSGWWERDALKEKLRANDEMTFYVRFGDYIARISAFLSVLLLLYFVAQLRIRK